MCSNAWRIFSVDLKYYLMTFLTFGLVETTDLAMLRLQVRFLYISHKLLDSEDHIQEHEVKPEGRQPTLGPVTLQFHY